MKQALPGEENPLVFFNLVGFRDYFQLRQYLLKFMCIPFPNIVPYGFIIGVSRKNNKLKINNTKFK